MRGPIRRRDRARARAAPDEAAAGPLYASSGGCEGDGVFAAAQHPDRRQEAQDPVSIAGIADSTARLSSASALA
jgi:hypothetical protein